MNKFLALIWLLSGLLFVTVVNAQTMPDYDALPSGQWTQIMVEDGVCLYGADYSFFVRPNENPSDNFLIYFQGGGACWDGLTCGQIGEFASFYDVDPSLTNFYQTGLFDFDNEDNPLADYNVIFLPYCSGDVYTGNTAYTFDVPPEAAADIDEIEVFFNGYNNSQLVLAWVYEQITAPEQLVVSGCSAGGYGAIAHAPFIMQQYADTPAIMLADSSHGVLASEWDGLETWGTITNLPDFMPDLSSVTLDDYDTTYHVERSAITFPMNTFAQFNSYIDGVQIGFYAASQGEELNFEENGVAIASQWSASLLTNLRQLATLDNFAHYTAGGFQHCVVNNDGFYEFDQAGVRFSDWVANVITQNASNITCNPLDGSCFTSPVDEE